MTLEESYNLSRDKWFDRIKDESRSQAKKGLCLAVVVLLFSLAFTISWQHQAQRILLICLLSVGGIASAWIVVNNLRFLLRLNRLNVPEQLLHWYEKRLKNDRNALFFAMLGFIICDPSLWYDIFNLDDKSWAMLRLIFMVALVVAMIVLLIHFNDVIDGEYITRHDEDIIDRLEDLIEQK